MTEIAEYASVVLTADVSQTWTNVADGSRETETRRAGDVGEVVMVHGNGTAFEVEFADPDSVYTVPRENLRPVDNTPVMDTARRLVAEYHELLEALAPHDRACPPPGLSDDEFWAWMRGEPPFDAEP